VLSWHFDNSSLLNVAHTKRKKTLHPPPPSRFAKQKLPSNVTVNKYTDLSSYLLLSFIVDLSHIGSLPFSCTMENALTGTQIPRCIKCKYVQTLRTSGVNEDGITENAITLFFAELENGITRKRSNLKIQ
jgi:hypothetical protein